LTDARAFAPATERNRAAILEVLREIAPTAGTALEVASGTGEHAHYFARHLPDLVFQPSDPDPAARESIGAWSRHEGLANVLPPLDLSAQAAAWPLEDSAAPFGLMLAINMIHISPWPSCEGLMSGAARHLRAGGALYLYGPYKRGGRHTAESNQAFDRWLRDQNDAWGVRDLEAVIDCAAARGLRFERVVEMPANNLSVIFRQGDPTRGPEGGGAG